MIHYLATAAHTYTMEEFLGGWGRTLADRVRIVPYEALPRLEQAEPGVYIFADLERLPVWQRALAARVHRRLAAAGPAFRTLNDPRRTLTRYPLLCALHRRGINDFRVFRARAWPRHLRFPVFLRAERDHGGRRSDLLRRRSELPGALCRLLRHPLRLRRGLLIVEFADTADARGTYRKHAALRVGPTLVPRHVLFDTHWEVKEPVLVDATTVSEEDRYVREFPHRARLREIFDLAGIDYGRVDYGLRGERIQVWEINTNPVVVPDPTRLAPARIAAQARSAALAVEAFRALDADLPAGRPLALWSAPAAPLRYASRVAGRTRLP